MLSRIKMQGTNTNQLHLDNTNQTTKRAIGQNGKELILLKLPTIRQCLSDKVYLLSYTQQPVHACTKYDTLCKLKHRLQLTSKHQSSHFSLHWDCRFTIRQCVSVQLDTQAVLGPSIALSSQVSTHHPSQSNVVEQCKERTCFVAILPN